MNHSIELAGGMALLMETGEDDGILTEQGTVVMDCQETDLPPKTEKWLKHVHSMLDRFEIIFFVLPLTVMFIKIGQVWANRLYCSSIP